MKSEPRAIIGKVFSSIEGEAQYAGLPTFFVHVADGHKKTVSQCLETLLSEPVVVLDTCEAVYFPWQEFAHAFLFHVQSLKRIAVLETRGEKDLSPYLSTAKTIYLNYTLGTTHDGNLNFLRQCDQVKFLCYDIEEFKEMTFIMNEVCKKTSAVCYVMPRGLSVAETGEFFDAFRTLKHARVLSEDLRIGLIVHELLGIE